MMRMLVLIAILLFTASIARAEVIERIVAVVGDEIILLSELEDAEDRVREALQAEASQRIPDASARSSVVQQEVARRRPQVLEQLIQGKLIVNQAKAWGISATDDEIDQNMERFAASQKMDLDGLRKMAGKEGLSWDAYRDEWRHRIIEARVQQRALGGRQEVTEADERAFYTQNYGGGGKEEAHLRLIFLKAPAAGEKREAVKKKMENLRAQIKKGKPFDEVASKNTEGPNADQGGDVGFLAKGQMQPDVEKAAFALKPGEVSSVISGPQGFFLLQLVECRGCDARPFEEVRSEIRARLLEARGPETFQAWIEDLEAKTHIERRL